jgi:hypothetical protein
LAAVFGSQGKNSVIGSVVLCVFYLLLFYFFMGTRTERHSGMTKQTILRTAFLLVILTELSITVYIGVKTVGTTDRNTYPKDNEQIRTLLDMRRPRASPSGDPSRDPSGVDFYRTDIDALGSSNDPFL